MTSLYLFDSNQELIKIIPQKDLIQARQKEELQENDLPIDRFTAEYKLDAFKDVEAIHYFAVKDLNKPNQFHMYFLKQPIIHENTVLLEGVQLGYKELKHFIIQEIHPRDRQAEFMMNQALQGTGWRVGYVAETVQASQHFYYMPALEALKVISGLFGIELVFKVEISGQKITDKWVEAYNRRGNRTMKRFTHGSNLLSIKGTIERDNVYTALIGRGRGEETEGGGFGRRITFEEVEWSVANGDPVDKPLGLNYVEIPSATEEYGINMPDGSKAPAMGVVEFQDIEEPDELLNAVYNELAYRIRPLVQYEATVADVGDVELGEVVGVHRYDLDLHYETRIFKLNRDYLNPKRTPVELGDKVIESRRDREVRTQKTIGNIDRNQADIRSEINRVGRTADGKNAITWGNDEPLIMRTGDLWYRDHPVNAGERQMMVYDGNGWAEQQYRADMLTGTLDAQTLNVVGINVDSIVGNTSSFVQSAWNGINNQIRIDTNGISVTGFGGGRRNLLTSTGIDFHDLWGTGGAAGYMGYFSSSATGANERMQFDRGTNPKHVIGIAARARHDVGFGYATANDTVFNPALIINGDSGNIRVYTGLSAGNGDSLLTLKGRIIDGQSGLTLQNRGADDSSGGGIHMTGGVAASTYLMENGVWRKFYSENFPRIGFSDGSAFSVDPDVLRLSAANNMDLSSNGMVKISLRNQVDLFTNISMGGNDIVNQSDERLKENIVASDYDALALFRGLQPKEWEWKDKERFGEQTEMGVIAQELKELEPRLVTQVADKSTDDGCAWVVNETEMNRRAWLAMHQLTKKVDEQQQEINELKRLVNALVEKE